MLRKRNQVMADFSCDNVSPKGRSPPLYAVSGLFAGFSPKGMDTLDSAKSPTSPLDFRVFSSLGNPFARSPRSPGLEGHPKSWDCNRVGLGLVDSLNGEAKNILLGSQLKIHSQTPNTQLSSPKDYLVLVTSPKSLPKNYCISSPNTEEASIGDESAHTSPLSSPKSNFEVVSPQLKNAQLGSSPLVPILSVSLPIPIDDGKEFIGSLSAREIELSEDYTCIISHGPNPKTTHIFGECILDGEAIRSLDCKNNKNVDMPPIASDDSLSSCFSCKKKLELGGDIYMYRGERAFCSCDCRDQDTLCEEEIGSPINDASSADHLGSSFHEEMFTSEITLAD